MTDPHRPADDAARALAATLLGQAAHAALGTLDGGAPMVTRVGVLWRPQPGPAGEPWQGGELAMLLSDLSDHARALRADPACSALLGEPGPRGDPLAHPRLTLRGRAEIADKEGWRAAWRVARPKSMLYFDFTDFNVWTLAPTDALLNAGFGRAHRLAPSDLS